MQVCSPTRRSQDQDTHQGNESLPNHPNQTGFSSEVTQNLQDTHLIVYPLLIRGGHMLFGCIFITRHLVH